MRFIHTETYRITGTSDPKYVDSNGKYAILSHRWIERQKNGPDKFEITFMDFKDRSAEMMSLDRDPRRKSGTGKHIESMNKIIDACRIARTREEKLEWLWMDTCCINQSNPFELDEAINSMFEWYSRAEVCYAYLADVLVPSSGLGNDPFRSTNTDRTYSEWFERGWTLQELLAPKAMEFYDRDWKFMETKGRLAAQIERVTGIGTTYVASTNPLATIKTASVAARMSWMAGRTTTRPEDIAYSMVGILDIQFKPSYGEGNQAFLRLEERLLEMSSDESIFAWKRPLGKEMNCFRKRGQGAPTFEKTKWGLLAPSPDCFRGCGQIVTTGQTVERLGGGYRRTNQGVQFQVSFKSGSEATNWAGLPRSKINWPLNCWSTERGKLETIVLHLVKDGDGYLRDQLDELDKDLKAKPSNNKSMGIDQQLTRSLIIKQPLLSEVLPQLG